MSEKNDRPVAARALEEASRALWWGGDAEFVPAEVLMEAAEAMFRADASRPAPTSDEVDDWAHVMFRPFDFQV